MEGSRPRRQPRECYFAQFTVRPEEGILHTVLTLLVVRHGVTEWNLTGRMQGHSDIPLAAEGEEQALRIAARLANTPLDAVYSSDLSRARCTAEAIAAYHNLLVHTTPDLRETAMGSWEGLSVEEIRARGDGGLWALYAQDSITYRPPDSEPLQDAWDRMADVLGCIREGHPTGCVALVGHGGTLRCLLASALGADLRGTRNMRLDNTGLSVVEYSAGRTVVRSVNDTCHLEGNSEG